MTDVTITIRKNGPYLVKGVVELKDADGTVYPAEQTFALCRCGASTKKPFCDGTHSKIGFDAAAKAVPASAESARPTTLLSPEAKLDEALDESFPASDPVAPMRFT